MLTPHQQSKLEETLEYLNKEQFVLLEGSAGVGKTYLINVLVGHLLKKGKVYLAAPTNAALEKLKSKMPELTDGISIGTTHQALNLIRKINNTTGKEEFLPNYQKKGELPLENISYLIVDEMSMLSTFIVENILRQAKINNLKVIFCGDRKQLPPVGEKISTIFEQDFPSVELTEIVRQSANSPIISLSRNLDRIKKQEGDINYETGEGFLFTSDAKKVIETLSVVNGTDDLKFLAYENAVLKDVNNQVRNKIYKSPAKIEVGEYIIFNAPYKETYFNNEKIKVETCVIKTLEFSYMTKLGNPRYGIASEFDTIELKVYCINNKKALQAVPNLTSWTDVTYVEVEIDNIIILHEDSEQDFEDLLAKLKKKAINKDIPWTKWHEFKDKFANFTYSHAITVHKSQGSTYQQVIIDIDNVNKVFDTDTKQKMFYTAVTRAAKLVIFYTKNLK